MALNSLPISRLINVDVVLTPLAAQAQDLNTLLVLGSSDIIDVVQRIRTYSTIDAVVADFGTNTPEYLAAVVYFEQSPQPQTLKIGRWAKTATHGTLYGAVLSAVSQLIATWNAIVTPVSTVFIDGVPFSIAPASFAAATNLNAIATLIQTALAAAVGGSTCIWDANNQQFRVESGTTGITSTVGFFKLPTALGNFAFTANPANNDQITLNGTSITFKNVVVGGTDVLIGASATATLANLLVMLQASVDVQLVKFTYSVVMTALNTGKLYMLAVATGVAGNALTTVKNVGVNIAVSGATLAGGTGTDFSVLAGLNVASSGAYAADGIALESAVTATTIFDTLFGQTWYALVIPEAVDAEHLLVAAYIEAANNKHLYGVGSTSAGILSGVSTTDIAYLLSSLEYNRTVVQYSSTNVNCISSFLGRAINVDYNGNSTVLTMMYKQEPGIVAESLTATQVGALETKNCNVIVKYNNNTAIVEKGTVASGSFVDEITGTDWLAVTVMTAIYNLLYTSPTKIPQTDPGTNLLVNQIEAVCSQGVANGLLAPGVWNSAGFGAISQGDYLPKGFYVYAPSVNTQLQATREARQSVPIQVAAKLAGAIHTVDVTINVNR